MGTARGSQENSSDESCFSVDGLHSLIIALAFAAQHICYCRAVSPSVDFYNAIKISRLTKQRRLETLWGRRGKGGG